MLFLNFIVYSDIEIETKCIVNQSMQQAWSNHDLYLPKSPVVSPLIILNNIEYYFEKIYATYILNILDNVGY